MLTEQNARLWLKRNGHRTEKMRTRKIPPLMSRNRESQGADPEASLLLRDSFDECNGHDA